ncbi:nitrogen regulatory protein P-II, partial [Sulfurirhabdus autotrophica]
EDDQVDELVEIIRSKGRTGQPEAGWVVVMDVEKAVRIDEG